MPTDEEKCENALYQDAEGRLVCASLKMFMDHSTTVQKRIEDKVDNVLDKFEMAFPDGDVDGHRRYHELKIEELLEKRRLRIAIQEKTISGLIWAGIILTLTALGSYLGIGGPKIP